MNELVHPLNSREKPFTTKNSKVQHNNLTTPKTSPSNSTPFAILTRVSDVNLGYIKYVSTVVFSLLCIVYYILISRVNDGTMNQMLPSISESVLTISLIILAFLFHFISHKLQAYDLRSVASVSNSSTARENLILQHQQSSNSVSTNVNASNDEIIELHNMNATTAISSSNDFVNLPNTSQITSNLEDDQVKLELKKKKKMLRLHKNFLRKRIVKTPKYPKWLQGEPDYSEMKLLNQKDVTTHVVRLPTAISLFDGWPYTLDIMLPKNSDGRTLNVQQAWEDSIEDSEMELVLADVGSVSVAVDYDTETLELIDYTVAKTWFV
ncbi:hypothetical protein HDU92_005871 [Lobulomyces angularis]|nr:hypothetical protein HDU92_005871 [Lobulomyces angularis]